MRSYIIFLVYNFISWKSVQGFWWNTRKASAEAERNIPLKGVNVEGNFIDFVGRIKTTQKYFNYHDFNIEAKYQFNLDLESTVIGMKMIVGERILVGLVKEKKSARQEYNNAIKNNKTSSLLEKSSNGIYSMNVGNIGPGEDILIEVEYITSLLTNDAGDVKFVLPTNIGMKYAGGEKTKKDRMANQETISQMTYSSTAAYPFSLNINWTSNSNIHSIRSLTHPIVVTNLTHGSLNIRCQSISSTGDFNLLATIPQRSSSMFMKQKGNDTYIIMNHRIDNDIPITTTLRSRDEEYLEKEYILIVDRSGSMQEPLQGWNGEKARRRKIDYAREASRKFIELLPERSRFNIVSFGSNFKPMFQRSVSASSPNKQAALQEIQSFDSNYGGTELYSVLHHTLINDIAHVASSELREQKIIILLTDGEVSNPDSVVQLTDLYIGKNRIFTIGIGQNVDRFLCKEIARVGNGYSEILIDNPSIDITITKIMKASMKPYYSQVSLVVNNEFGFPLHKNLYPDFLNSFYFKLPTDKINLSSSNSLMIKAWDSMASQFVSMQVLMDQLEVDNSVDFIPQLYAIDRIRQLEEGKVADVDTRQEESIRLSINYQVMNSLTSFVVIDEKKIVKLTGLPMQSIVIPQSCPSEIDEDSVTYSQEQTSGVGNLISFWMISFWVSMFLSSWMNT